MNIDYSAASFWLTLAVLALSAWNAYSTASLKLWAMERFITKKDFLDTLHMWHKTEGKEQRQ